MGGPPDGEDRAAPAGIPIARRAERVIPPPFAQLKERYRDLLAAPDAIDLSQAVPSYDPPEVAVEALAAAARRADSHRYTPDPGLPECRDAVAAYLRRRHHARVDAKHVLLTPGANAAFHFAANVLFDPGDRVALLSPYYFNHAMSIGLLGGTVVEIPWTAPASPAEILDRASAAGARLLVLVTPGNPTGRMLPADGLAAIVSGARERGLPVVVDETYLEFPANGASVTALALEGWEENVVVLGTFSKSLAVTGHRVGYVCAGERLFQEVLKVQDAAAICAPRLGQIAVAATLAWPGLDDWLESRRLEVEGRLAAFAEALAAAAGPFSIECQGAFFAWLRWSGLGRKDEVPDGACGRSAPSGAAGAAGTAGPHGAARPSGPARLSRSAGSAGPPGSSGAAVADRLMRERRVLVLSGETAGGEGRARLRVAVGNAGPDRLRAAAGRIQSLPM